MGFAYTTAAKHEYEKLFSECILKSAHKTEVDGIVSRINSGKALHYDDVSDTTGVPWFVIGVIHYLEAGLNFQSHLHNGDPLSARTVHVPKGYPHHGNPPFTWRESAIDALTLDGLTTETDWSVGRILYHLEKFNGFGYHMLTHPIPSPYLWSYSQIYTKGKYGSDGHYDPNLVSKQAGAAVILKEMADRGLIDLGFTVPLRLLVNNVATTVTVLTIADQLWVQIRPFLKLFNINIDTVIAAPPTVQFQFSGVMHSLPDKNIGGSGFVALKDICAILNLTETFDEANNVVRIVSP